MKISDTELDYYGMKFVRDKVRKYEGITFEQYLIRELKLKNKL